ncbi:MAG: hypothetical protein IIU61_07390 [Alistipes sp.]|nr:hypothetical protein [Alistipes sp.]
MKFRVAIYTLMVILSLSCRKQQEPQSIAGYIIDTTNSNQIILFVPDSIPAERSYVVDDNTLFSGGTVMEGNIAEVIFLPSDDETLPVAQSVTADVTYPRIIGRWTTDKDDELQIDLELQPHGKIEQRRPDTVINFESWQLTGEENTITLHGSLSLPPVKVDSKKIKADSVIIPTRQDKRFSVQAELAYDEEGNTEQHKVLIITTDKGRTSKLYPAWE